ncbi:hypothetical protein F4808DRAFT_342501 [Astrocystis sublimbata]|nr:hypothetical protein F4808DRAFT_342501 [Astrocystis sublimbata]
MGVRKGRFPTLTQTPQDNPPRLFTTFGRGCVGYWTDYSKTVGPMQPSCRIDLPSLSKVAHPQRRAVRVKLVLSLSSLCRPNQPQPAFLVSLPWRAMEMYQKCVLPPTHSSVHVRGPLQGPGRDPSDPHSRLQRGAETNAQQGSGDWHLVGGPSSPSKLPAKQGRTSPRENPCRPACPGVVMLLNTYLGSRVVLAESWSPILVLFVFVCLCPSA